MDCSQLWPATTVKNVICTGDLSGSFNDDVNNSLKNTSLGRIYPYNLIIEID